MASQYEVEHNVQFTEPRSSRRIDMASFFSLLNQISSHPTGSHTPHQNPHATPTPVDAANLFRMLQDQLLTLHSTAPDAANAAFLQQLVASLDQDIRDPPTELRGCSQEFVDMLDRVPRKGLARGDDCAICRVEYLEDEYCLVVELPCKGRHRFDLECVGPWLMSKGTCPMCREEVGEGRKKKKEEEVKTVDDDDEENDDPDMLYA